MAQGEWSRLVGQRNIFNIINSLAATERGIRMDVKSSWGLAWHITQHFPCMALISPVQFSASQVEATLTFAQLTLDWVC